METVLLRIHNMLLLFYWASGGIVLKHTEREARHMISRIPFVCECIVITLRVGGETGRRASLRS